MTRTQRRVVGVAGTVLMFVVALLVPHEWSPFVRLPLAFFLGVLGMLWYLHWRSP